MPPPSYFIIFLLILFLQLVNGNFNSQPTTSTLVNNNANGTTVCISPKEDMLIAGFSDGTIKMLDMNLNEICSGVSNNASQIVQLIWLPSFGPVSLDDRNHVILWASDCSITNRIIFSDSITRINWHQDAGDNDTAIGLVIINFNSRMQEYDIQTGENTLIYHPANSSEVFIEMIYNPDGSETVLLASTTDSMIRKFQIANGTELDSYEVESPIERMTKITVITGDVVIGIAQNSDIIRFDSTGQILDRGKYNQANAIAICPTTKEFALSYTSTHTVGLYLYAGQQQKIISSINGFTKDIDCSASYLAVIDDLGYINIYTYEEFKSWIIGLIAGIAGGLVLLIIGVIVFIKLRKRWAEQASQQKYGLKKLKKYPRNNKENITKAESMKMLKLSTLQTTIRQ